MNYTKAELKLIWLDSFIGLEYKIKKGASIFLSPSSSVHLRKNLRNPHHLARELKIKSQRELPSLHATRYAEGGAESCEYCDEKLDDVLPNVFVDSHSNLINNV